MYMYRFVFLTTLFVLILAFIIFAADTGSMPQSISSLYNFPYGDAVGHFLLMGLLSLLINLSLSCKRIKLASRDFLLGNIIALLVVTLEELSQLYLKNRSFSVLDLASSYTGILVFGYLAVPLNKSVLSVKSVSK